MTMNVIDQTTSSNFASNSEFDSGFDEVQDLMKEMVKEDHGISGDIMISEFIGIKNDEQCRIVNHNDISMKDFKIGKGFYEVERGNYQRLHFDYDFKKDDEVNESIIDNIFILIETISEKVGDYEVHGYSNDEEIFNYLNNYAHVCEFKADAEKKLSIHITFNQKYFERNDIVKYFGGHTKVFCHGIESLHDASIYFGNGQQRLFRHMISNGFKRSKGVVSLEKKNGISRKLFKFENVKRALITASQTDEFMKCFDLLGIDGLKFEFEELVEKVNVEKSDEKIDQKLYEAIIAGFVNLPNDKQIHGDAKPIEEEITTFALFSHLFALVKVGIDEDVISKDIELIFNGGRVTASAMRRWDEQVDKGHDNPADHYGGLLKMLKIHNPDYYQQTIKPLMTKADIEAVSGNDESFKNSKYTSNDFIRNVGKFRSVNELFSKLRLCVAMTTGGRYIVRTVDIKRNHVIKDYSMTDIKKMFDYKFEYPLTEAEKEKLRQQKKKVVDNINYQNRKNRK